MHQCNSFLFLTNDQLRQFVFSWHLDRLGNFVQILKKEQSECRILPRFIGGGQPLPSKVQLSNSMAMNQNFFKSCMQKKFCWEICAIHRCCFIFQIVLITALYSSCNGEVTVGLDPSLGKSTDETMQLFYLCGFVQTYGIIGGLFLHT